MSGKEKTPPILKRDEHNQIVDPTEADRIVKELTQKLVTEQRLHEKDQSMHFAKTGKRDIVVHMALTVLPEVNGHPIFGEKEKEYQQWCFRLNARMLPTNRATLNKALAEICQFVKQGMMRIGCVRE